MAEDKISILIDTIINEAGGKSAIKLMDNLKKSVMSAQAEMLKTNKKSIITNLGLGDEEYSKKQLSRAKKYADITSKLAKDKERESKQVIKEEARKLKQQNRITKEILQQKDREAKNAQPSSMLDKQLENLQKAGAKGGFFGKLTNYFSNFRMEMLGVMFVGMQLQRTFGGLFKSMIDNYKKIANEANPLSKALTMLEANFMYLKYSIMEAIAPMLIEWINTFINWIDILTSNPEKLEFMGKAIIGLAIAGAALFAVGQGTMGISSIFQALVLLGSLFTPGMLGLTALTGLQKLTMAIKGLSAVAGIISIAFGIKLGYDSIKKAGTNVLKDLAAALAIGIGVGLIAWSVTAGAIAFTVAATIILALDIALDNNSPIRQFSSTIYEFIKGLLPKGMRLKMDYHGLTFYSSAKMILEYQKTGIINSAGNDFAKYTPESTATFPSSITDAAQDSENQWKKYYDNLSTYSLDYANKERTRLEELDSIRSQYYGSDKWTTATTVVRESLSAQTQSIDGLTESWTKLIESQKIFQGASDETIAKLKEQYAAGMYTGTDLGKAIEAYNASPTGETEKTSEGKKIMDDISVAIDTAKTKLGEFTEKVTEFATLMLSYFSRPNGTVITAFDNLTATLGLEQMYIANLTSDLRWLNGRTFKYTVERHEKTVYDD